MKRKKGQFVSLGILIMLIIFAIIWVAGLATMLNDLALQAVTDNGVGGFAAFFYTNLNLWVFIAWFVALIVTTQGVGAGQ